MKCITILCCFLLLFSFPLWRIQIPKFSLTETAENLISQIRQIFVTIFMIYGSHPATGCTLSKIHEHMPHEDIPSFCQLMACYLINITPVNWTLLGIRSTLRTEGLLAHYLTCRTHFPTASVFNQRWYSSLPYVFIWHHQLPSNTICTKSAYLITGMISLASCFIVPFATRKL